MVHSIIIIIIIIFFITDYSCVDDMFFIGFKPFDNINWQLFDVNYEKNFKFKDRIFLNNRNYWLYCQNNFIEMTFYKNNIINIINLSEKVLLTFEQDKNLYYDKFLIQQVEIERLENLLNMHCLNNLKLANENMDLIHKNNQYVSALKKVKLFVDNNSNLENENNFLKQKIAELHRRNELYENELKVHLKEYEKYKKNAKLVNKYSAQILDLSQRNSELELIIEQFKQNQK